MPSCGSLLSLIDLDAGGAARVAISSGFLPGRLEDQTSDRVGLRDQRKVARLYFDGLGVHALGHEPFEIGIDRPVLGRDGIETRLRPPRRMRRLAREQRLLE